MKYDEEIGFLWCGEMKRKVELIMWVYEFEI